VPRKKQSAPVQVIDVILHSQIGATLNDKLRQALGLNPLKSVVDERLKAEAREAGEKIRSRMEEDNRPYKILDVDPNAEDIVIRAAYRAKAKKYHPDIRGSNKKMAEINDAYKRICEMRGMPK